MSIFDKAKDVAGKAKDKVDDLVEKNADKIPDSVEKAYGKVSGAAEKVIPGSDETSPSEQLIEEGAEAAATPEETSDDET